MEKYAASDIARAARDLMREAVAASGAALVAASRECARAALDVTSRGAPPPLAQLGDLRQPLCPYQGFRVQGLAFRAYINTTREHRTTAFPGMQLHARLI